MCTLYIKKSPKKLLERRETNTVWRETETIPDMQKKQTTEKKDILKPKLHKKKLVKQAKTRTKDVYERARVLSLCLMQGKSFGKKLLLEGSIVRRQGRCWRRDHSRHDDVGPSWPPLVFT